MHRALIRRLAFEPGWAVPLSRWRLPAQRSAPTHGYGAAAAIAGAIFGGASVCSSSCDSAGRSGDHASRTEVLYTLKELQKHFLCSLEDITTSDGRTASFRPASWSRDGGVHGGGTRFETDIASGDAVFNRASINVSGVHYADLAKAPIDSASALSVILHPRNPHAPSMHFHISYVQVRNGKPYWRMIADLNPAIEDPVGTFQFESRLRQILPEKLYEDAKLFGERYFFIPALRRTRGASHIFIAKLEPGLEMSPTKCVQLARELGENIIDVYCNLVRGAVQLHPDEFVDASERALQLGYHTLYLFQVLTLDRGTTHGLLSHNENDVGCLGSLPSEVDGALLKSWLSKVTPDVSILLERIIAVLPQRGHGVSEITASVRQALANTVREYYREDMKRMRMQADMDLKWWDAQTKQRLV